MKIKEDGYKVIIDNFVFDGQVEQDNFCTKCKFNLVYYDDFDAYFCPKCNSWIESKCSDSKCKYCFKRPEKPLPNK
ncbi:hypothetical protein C3943_12180 [Lysinibacillus sp. B2A1]|nr:hypothetical protein C3943_12180 [Lysinibacillus sp. B2A1]